jgi:prevent-host-death family protein
MPTTTLTSREFHQDSAKVKRAAANGPVIITDRGKPALVLLSYDAYEELLPKRISVAEALAMPGAEDIELPLPERTPYRHREIDW